MKVNGLRLITVFLAAASGLLGGCATSNKPVQMGEEERANVIRSGAIAAVHDNLDIFFFETPAGAMVAGGVAKWADSNNAPTWYRITNHHKVPAFAASVQKNFLDIIGKRKSPYGFNGVEKGVALHDDEHPVDLAQFGAPYVLQFRTENGVFVYQLLGPNTYKMSYEGEAALVRIRDKQVIWRGACNIEKDRNPVQTVPGDDFLRGNGEKLRAAAAYVQNACAEELVAQFVQTQGK